MATDTTSARQAPQPPESPVRRPMLIGKGWVQAVAIVMLFGFFVMGILAYRTYTDSMPQPAKVVTSSGTTVFTTEDITAGQELFQARGLMEYGSILGHGAYLGPDFTADYLRRSTEIARSQQVAAGTPNPNGAVVQEYRTSRYDASTGTLTFTDGQAKAFTTLEGHYAQFFGLDSTANGLVPRVITDPQEIHEITSFFAWTAWAAAAERPGHSYSYTNNWPAEPRVENGPTADVIVWSVLSLIVLLGGTGALFAVYGRWSRDIGWHSAEAP
ncbi:MAG: nitric-oxide reductase large subunit, partial [Terracoccus sp.]